jgi:hypothetical protein
MLRLQDTMRSGEQCQCQMLITGREGGYSRHDWNMSLLSHTEGRRDGLRLNQKTNSCSDQLALIVTNYLLDLEAFSGT